MTEVIPTETVTISRELAKKLERVLGCYSMQGNYMAPRTGGVLAGCPRGAPPTPMALAMPVKSVYDDFLKEVAPQW